MHPWPFVSIVVLAVCGPIPIGRGALITIAMFGLMLLPYVMVSYYDRYAAMLVGLKMLLILYGWDALKTAVSGNRFAPRWTRPVGETQLSEVRD